MEESEDLIVSIDKIVEPRNEKVNPQEELNLPFIGLDDIEAHTMKLLGTKVANELKSSAKKFYKGDVLYSRLRPYLNKVWTADREGICSSEFIVFPENSNLHSKYLAYRLNASDFVSFANSLNAGDRPRVNFDQISKFNIPVTNFSYQVSIVAKIEELFSELDKGIESLQTAREQLKVYRQAVLKHAFEGKLTEQWRKDNADKLESPEQLLARISAPEQPRGGRQASIEVIEGIAALAVNKPLKAAPDGWIWTPLLRVARQETGHTPSRKHPEYWDSGSEYWIGIADARLHHGKIINNTLQKVTPLGLDNSSARTLPAKTVCLSRTASVGYVTITGKPMATSQDFATWTCTKALEPKFLMYALIAEGDEIRRFGKGTTHTTIYFPEIRALHICLPSIEEQRAIIDIIEDRLEKSDKTIADIECQLNQAETLRQSILKKAFSGQLVPQDPNDEPASELLARIQAEKAVLSAKAKKTPAKRARKAKEVSN